MVKSNKPEDEDLSSKAFNYVPTMKPNRNNGFISRYTAEQWEQFFQRFMITGVVARASRESGIGMDAIYYQKNIDKLFRTRFEICRQIGAEALEEEAFRRAVEGVDEPVFFQGIEMGSVKRFSDGLLTILLKGSKPDKYRENSTVEIKRPGARRELEALTDEELENIVKRKVRNTD